MSLLVPGVLVYLAHPRSASMATEAALSEHFGVEPTPDHHRRLEEFKDYVGEPVVTTIRNPFAMLASWFVLSGERHMRKFLLNYNHSEMVKDGSLYYHMKHADYLLHYERLDEELNSCLKELGFGPVTIPRTNVTSNKKPHHSYFDAYDMELVQSRFYEDLRLWEEFDNGRHLPQ